MDLHLVGVALDTKTNTRDLVTSKLHGGTKYDIQLNNDKI